MSVLLFFVLMMVIKNLNYISTLIHRLLITYLQIDQYPFKCIHGLLFELFVGLLFYFGSLNLLFYFGSLNLLILFFKIVESIVRAIIFDLIVF